MAALPVTGAAGEGWGLAGFALATVEGGVAAPALAGTAGVEAEVCAAPALRITGTAAGAAGAVFATALFAALEVVLPGAAPGCWAHPVTASRHSSTGSERHRCWRISLRHRRPHNAGRVRWATNGEMWSGNKGNNNGRNFTAGVYRSTPPGAMGERTEGAEKYQGDNIGMPVPYKDAHSTGGNSETR